MTIKQWRDYLAEFPEDDFGVNKTIEAILTDWEAALEQARREGAAGEYRRGVEEMREQIAELIPSALERARREGVEKMMEACLESARHSYGYIYVTEIESEAASLLAAPGAGDRYREVRRCILCNVPMAEGSPTCPACGGHAWRNAEEGQNDGPRREA